MLDAGADQFAEAFRILAGAEALPAVFHCAAGKDRTGILAVLILGALGVERDLIVADYALTQAAMERILGRLAQDPERKARIDRSPRSFFVADGDAVARLLDDIERAHGSVRGFVRHLGVPAADLDGLEAHLLA
jgi:protein-tyrosine phosphatase